MQVAVNQEGNRDAWSGTEPTVEHQREMVWLYDKDARKTLSMDFFTSEFRCRCTSPHCRITLVHPQLIQTLQILRTLLGWPMSIVSGFRCKSHNKVLGGTPHSYHTRGMAVDIRCLSPDQLEAIICAAAQLPAVGGIGHHPQRRHVHIDLRPRAPFAAPVIWSD